MKILVTGAAGFIGSHACERLNALGHEVIGLDNFNDYYNVSLKRQNENTLKQQNIVIINYDLAVGNLASVVPKDINYIFHFAAQPGISASTTFENYLRNNVNATKYLIDYAQTLENLKLLVNIGTSSVYGFEATCQETEPPKPMSYYGITKLTAEQLILQKSRTKFFKACSLRLYSVIGPRERPEKMYSKLIECAFNNKAFTLYNGSETHLRSFTYVSDIIDGIVSVIDKENIVDGECINLGSRIEYSTLEGIKIVESIIGKKIMIEKANARVGDQLKTKANIKKAERLLGYNPKTTLQESVKAQIEWYKLNFL